MSKNIIQLLLIGTLATALASGCIISSDPDPCDGVTCDGYGVCREDASGAFCDCDAGYHAEGLHCIFDGYTISFEWVFDTTQKSCMQALVADVHVELLEGSTALLSEDVTCTAGGADIETIPDGTYTLNLLGKNAAGDEMYRASLQVVVDGQDEDLGVIALDPFGFMKFLWTFGAGELTCAEAGVDRVRVIVKDATGTNTLFEATPIPDCEDDGAIITDWELGDYNLILEGVCLSDLSTGYVLDEVASVALAGENDYGTLILTDIGGCP